jgi:hypothetical protein
MIKGSLIQDFNGPHICTACGKEHFNCCGMCAEYDPRDYGLTIPCERVACNHNVCSVARAAAGA